MEIRGTPFRLPDRLYLPLASATFECSARGVSAIDNDRPHQFTFVEASNHRK